VTRITLVTPNVAKVGGLQSQAMARQGHHHETPERSFKPAGLTPTLQKSESFRAKASKGAAVVDLLQALGNAGYEVLRLSRRVKKMA